MKVKKICYLLLSMLFILMPLSRVDAALGVTYMPVLETPTVAVGTTTHAWCYSENGEPPAVTISISSDDFPVGAAVGDLDNPNSGKVATYATITGYTDCTGGYPKSLTACNNVRFNAECKTVETFPGTTLCDENDNNCTSSGSFVYRCTGTTAHVPINVFRAGKITVTCRWGEGDDNKTSAVLTVTDDVKTVYVGEKTTSKIVSAPTSSTTPEMTCSGTDNIRYTSSDESVATVDSNGLVTGVKEGYSTITATSVCGKNYGVVHVTKKGTPTPTNNGGIVNPQTGSLPLYLLIAIIPLSFILAILGFKKITK